MICSVHSANNSMPQVDRIAAVEVEWGVFPAFELTVLQLQCKELGTAVDS